MRTNRRQRLESELMSIAPAPVLAGFEGLDDRVRGFVIVLRCVLVPHAYIALPYGTLVAVTSVRSNALRSHRPSVAAASYVLWRKLSNTWSGDFAVRTTSYGSRNSLISLW